MSLKGMSFLTIRRRRIHAGDQSPGQPTRSRVLYLLASVSPILDDQVLYAARADFGKFKASIGSTDVSGDEYLIDDDSATQTSTDDNMIELDSNDEDEDQALEELYDRATKGEIDLDTIMMAIQIPIPHI